MKINSNLSVKDSYGGTDKTKASTGDAIMDFANILSVASESKTDTTIHQSETVPVASSEQLSKKDNNVGNQAQPVAKDNGTTDDKQVDSDKANLVKDDNSKVNTEDTTIPSQPDAIDKEPDMDKVVEAISSLLIDLADILNLSVDELTQTMEQLNFSVDDLLNPDNLKELMLTVNQADSTDLLVDEGLSEQFQAIMDSLNLCLSQLPDDFENLTESIPVTMLTENLPEQMDFVMQEDIPETGMEFVDADAQTEPVVIVENNRTDDSNGKKEFSENTEHLESDVVGKPVIDSKKQDNEIHFENPILQNIQESLEMTDDVALSGEITRAQVQVIDQIVEQVKVQMNQDNTTLQMQLYPEHLGRIQINVVSKEGIMTAQIVAENDAAKQAIEGGLASLKETMENQNIKIEAIEVMVSTTGFQQNDEKNEFANPQSKGKKSGKIDLNALEDGDVDADDMGELEKMKVSGSSVSYSV